MNWKDLQQTRNIYIDLFIFTRVTWNISMHNIIVFVSLNTFKKSLLPLMEKIFMFNVEYHDKHFCFFWFQFEKNIPQSHQTSSLSNIPKVRKLSPKWKHGPFISPTPFLMSPPPPCERLSPSLAHYEHKNDKSWAAEFLRHCERMYGSRRAGQVERR